MKNNEITFCSKVISQFAANKQKAGLAAALVIIMVFMWVRMFTKVEPASAEAEQIAAQQMQTQEKPERKIKFIELPVIEGRHDEVKRDFFEIDESFTGISKSGKSGLDADEYAEILKKGLKVEAISIGEKSEAFINGQLVSAGDKIKFLSDGDELECVIEQIRDNVVHVRFGGRVTPVTCSGE